MEPVARHYHVDGLLDAIFAALKAQGKDLDHLAVDDLAPVDAFHVRGREATVELAEAAGFREGETLLDLGSGLGGSCRYLADRFGLTTQGIDLTPEFVAVANDMSRRVGLQSRTHFHVGSVTSVPFPDRSFDAVWTEHVQMNVEDKRAMYSEAFRVLRPGGRLAFHDVFQGEAGEVLFPVPWATEPSLSYLMTPADIRSMLQDIGFEISWWQDKTSVTAEWMGQLLQRFAGTGLPPLSLGLLIGPDAATKLGNVARSAREGRIAVIQAVVTRVD